MRAKIGSIVVVVCGLLVCALRGAALSKATPKATSREYKIRLRAADFADETERAGLWRTIAAMKADSARRGQTLDEKPCRRILYFDTASRDLEKAGWLIRRREEFGGAQCRGPHAVRVETTLKVRGPVAVSQAVFEEQWTAHAKIQEDRLIGRGTPNPSAVLSVSANVDGEAELSKISDVRTLFEGALSKFNADAALSVSCRVVLERRWELKSIHLPRGIDHLELALWYGSLADSTVPRLGELSFSVKLNDLEAVNAADRLEGRLIHQLADQLAEPGSKATAMYGCDRK